MRFLLLVAAAMVLLSLVDPTIFTRVAADASGPESFACSICQDAFRRISISSSSTSKEVISDALLSANHEKEQGTQLPHRGSQKYWMARAAEACAAMSANVGGGREGGKQASDWDVCSVLLEPLGRFISAPGSFLKLLSTVREKQLDAGEEGKKCHSDSAQNFFSLCQEMKMCPKDEDWERVARESRQKPNANYDVKVSLSNAMRSKVSSSGKENDEGTVDDDDDDFYYHARITVIDNDPIPSVALNRTQKFLSFFDYVSSFKWFWTNKTMYTALKRLHLPQGGANESVTQFEIDDDFTVNVTIPARRKKKPSEANLGSSSEQTDSGITRGDDDGIRGLLVADPCFSSRYVECECGEKWKVFDRLTRVLNTVVPRPEVSLWALIGDNFYDPYGTLAPRFFEQLTPEVKNKPLLSIVGNHDFWEHGKPSLRGFDTLGNGYLQYYLMDTAAAVLNTRNKSADPLDLSVDPFQRNSSSSSSEFLPHFSNFFTINFAGNVAMLTYSGAHNKSVALPYFAEACRIIKRQDPDWVFILGHWSDEDYGCQPGMDTINVRKTLTTSVPGCSDFGSERFVVFEGHRHVNTIVDADVRFRVGGFGMKQWDPTENFGFPYFDTTGGKLTVGYFPVVGINGTRPLHNTTTNASATGGDDVDDDSFTRLIECFERYGLVGCKHLSVVWMEKKKKK